MPHFRGPWSVQLAFISPETAVPTFFVNTLPLCSVAHVHVTPALQDLCYTHFALASLSSTTLTLYANFFYHTASSWTTQAPLSFRTI